MFKLHWSELSYKRIIETGNYIALNAPIAADKWINEILSKERLILENPNIGRMVPEFKSRLIREIIVGEYRLIYQINQKTITVMTVINCRELLKELGKEW